MPVPVVAASAVILITFPVRVPSAWTSRIVPLVTAEAIFAVFAVVCSESISSAYPPSILSESINTSDIDVVTVE